MEEERVVGLAGELRDRERGGVGEAVAGADHEALEGVPRVEVEGLDGLQPLSGPWGGSIPPPPPRSGCARGRIPASRRAVSRAAAVAALDPGADRARGGETKAVPSADTGRRGASQRSKVEAGRLARRSSVTRTQIEAEIVVEGVFGHRRAIIEPRRGPPRRLRRRARILREKGETPIQSHARGPTKHRLYCLAGREADVSTQEAKARPHSRVPRPHAHARRPASSSAGAARVASGSRRERRLAGRAAQARPPVTQRRLRSRLSRGPVARQPLPRPLHLPARDG